MKKLTLTIITVLFCLTSNIVWSAEKEKDTVSQTMVVLDKLASELLESLDTRSKIAIRPFYKKETGLSDSLNSSLINAMVSSLQRKSNYKINLIARDKLKKVWQEVDEFKSTDFNKLVKEAGADVLIIGDVRTRKQGLELSFRAYDTADSAKKGEVGKILASTRLRYLKLNWQNEAGFSPESTKKSLNTITDTLKTIQKSFSIISKSGGLIQNPTQPEQFYHNARLQELGGDYSNARRSYNRYLSFKLNYLDPHLRYQTFIKMQEGRAGAREIYTEIFERNNNFITEFARILLFNAPKRTTMLEKYISKYPKFAPAYYELSREFSEARKGTQSLTDKKKELKSLRKFVSLRKEGKFFKYFIDKELASKWVGDAKRRLSALSIIAESASAPPVAITGMLSNSGWSINVNISETPREIFYRLENDGDFKSTGKLQYIDQSTGLRMAMSSFQIPMIKRTKIFIKYLDISKTERGPFELKFDAYEQLLNVAKSEVYNPPSSWVTIKSCPHCARKKNGSYVPGKKGRLLLHVSTVTGMRCGVSELRYGIDTKSPNQKIKLGPCNIRRHRRTGKRDIRDIDLPKYTNAVSVQLVFDDGTLSGVHNFENPNKKRIKTSNTEIIKKKLKQRSSLAPCPSDPNQRYHDCFGTSISDYGKYVGNWKDDKPSGQGTFTYSDGRKYIGEYKNGKPSGYGTFSYPDGRKYVGQYKNGKRNGQGTFTDADGQKKKGIWKNSKFQ